MSVKESLTDLGRGRGGAATPLTRAGQDGGTPRAEGGRSRQDGAMAKTTIYFVSDLHGSSVCFRKFINAAPIYGANVLVLGADLAGKAIQQIVRQPGGTWSARFAGVERTVDDGEELAALEKLIADHGYYPYRAEPGQLEAMEAAGTQDG